MTTLFQRAAQKTILAAAALALPIAMMPTSAMAQSNGYYNPPSNAHTACKSDETQDKLAGGVLGAVLGGVLGSQIAGDGARTEGSAIGAVLGGLAGAGIADKRVDCDPDYGNQTYGRQTQPSYGTQTYGNGNYNGGGYNDGYQAPRYQDRVTYSNHPVYSQPNYGATYGDGAMRNGTTYTTGRTTYPVYNNGSYRQASYGNSNPTYRTTAYTPRVRPGNNGRGRAYGQNRNRRNVMRQSGTHYHGSYVCTDMH
jgi:hypothetical protein